MNAKELDVLIVRADGCLQLGSMVCEPWPSLTVHGGTLGGLSRELLASRPGDALWPFAQRIPEEVKVVVRGIRSSASGLLELAAANPAHAVRLMRLCPALAVNLVHHAQGVGTDRRDWLRQALGLPWRRLAGRLGLPARPRTINLMRRIPAGHCTPATVQTFCAHLQNGHPHLRIVAHLSRVTRDTVALLGLEPALINSRLLMASAASPADEEPVRWTVMAVRWLLDKATPGRPWPYGQLDATGLARVEIRLRRRYQMSDEIIEPFPPPPVEGVSNRIVPLRDFWSLTTESDRQINCALAFAGGVVFGETYLFSVMWPERATLVLQRSPDRTHWVIEELRARDNSPVRPETMHYVQTWLDREQKLVVAEIKEES